MITNMTTSDGYINDELKEFITVQAKSGVSMLITEGLAVNKRGRLFKNIRIDKDDYLANISSLADIMHDNDSKLLVQLYHAGREANNDFTPLAPSMIPSMITKIIEKNDQAEFDRAHLVELGDFSLDFEIVYYMKTSDYGRYLDTQQQINFEILDAFNSEGITMPFPTQTIFLGGSNDSQLPSNE